MNYFKQCKLLNDFLIKVPVAAVISSVPEGKMIAVSEMFENIFEYSYEEVNGKSSIELALMLDVSERERLINIFREKGKIQNIETKVRSRTGKIHNVSINSIGFSIGDQQYILTMIKDLSEHEQLEKSFKESEQKYSLLFSTSPTATILFKMPEVIIVDVNEAAEKLTGFTRQEMLGKSTIELGIVRNIDPEAVIASYNKNLGIVDHDMKIYTKNDEERIIVVNAYPIELNGKSYALSTMQDITERKQVEEKLRESEEKFSKVFLSSPVAFSLVTTPDGKFQEVNPAFCNLIGFSREEVIGKTGVELGLLGAEEREKISLNIIEKGETFRNLEINLRTRDGSIRTVLASGETVTLGGVIYRFATFTDITERKRAEESLNKSEQRYKELTERLQEVVYSVDPITFKNIYVNKVVEKITGYTQEEWKSNPYLWNKLLYEEDKERVFKEFEDIKQRGTSGIIIYRIQHPNRGVRWLEDHITLTKDQDGNIIGINGVIYDITDRRQSEEALKQREAQLMNLYQQLNNIREEERASISREVHDELGQALTALKIDLNWILNNLQYKDKVIDRIKDMQNNIDTTIKNVQRISAELRPNMLDDLGLKDTIEWYLEEFENRTGIKCIFDLDEIFIDDDRINLTLFRVFQEAITNVARHSKAKNVFVKLYSSDTEIILEIEDDGIGIDEKNLNLKSSFGLTSMRERINLINGKFNVFTKELNGTKIIISIPNKVQ